MARKRDSAISPREAIQIVQSCQKERLPYVLMILRSAGYDFPDDAVEIARSVGMDKVGKAAARRKDAERLWTETADPTVKMLRDAYNMGISFTDINRLSGVNRTVMYEYLKGTRKIPDHVRPKLTDSLEEIMNNMNKEGGEEHADGRRAAGISEGVQEELFEADTARSSS